MLNKEITAMINSQINKELYSAYLYLDFANNFIDNNLAGFGNWFKVQAMEERDHANLFMQYLQSCGEKVVLETIQKPDIELDTLRKALSESYEHECYVTSEIYKIYDKAMELKDFKTLEFLNWFVKEQREEEESATDLLSKFDFVCGDNKGLYLLDKELNARMYTPPTLLV